MQAILALEDGRVFRGKGYGAKGECYGEVVFNTSITGYQEIFTDPSYSGQIVVLTNPQIGNYGTNQEDNEATRPWIEGLIVREFSKVSSNWRSQQVAEEYLEQFKVPVLSDIDTRALVRHLRDHGVMRGVVSTIESDAQKLVARLDHAASRIAITAERALLAALDGGCQVPIGGYGTVHGNEVHLRAIVASPDGLRVVRAEATGADPQRLGQELGREMLKRGAREILQDVYAA